MPFKSKSQARKFFELHDQGKISTETLQKWLKATPSVKALPEKVSKPKPFKVTKVKVIK